MTSRVKTMNQYGSRSDANAWKRVRVGDSLRLVNGSAFKPTDWTDEGVPIVRIQNLNNPESPYNRTIRQLPDKFKLRGGELLFAWSGTPGTSFGAHIWHGSEAWLNQHIFNVLFDENEWDKKFLQFAINQNLSDYIRAAHGGAGLAHITKGMFEESELLQPSLGEQRRIVAEIEKQFSRLEEGMAALKRVQANLKRYRATVLKAACEGHLVPTEAELSKAKGKRLKAELNQSTSSFSPHPSSLYESGSQLLARILAERRQKWQGRGKYKEPAAPETAKLPKLPEGWTWASVDQLCSHITSGSRDWSQYYGRGQGTFILAQNVRPMLLDMTERQSVAAPVGDAETERTRVQVYDLLVTIVGAKTGDVCRIPNQLDDHFVCQSVALLRPVFPTLSTFMEIYLASHENGQAQWKSYIYGQGRPHLGFEQLRISAIALPPLAEQKRIVAEVERLLSVIYELESVVSANLQRAGRLRQAVLQKAFTGALC